MQTQLRDYAVLVPVWQPEDRLISLVQDLIRAGFGALIVVDDGSGPACSPVLGRLQSMPSVAVLRHTVNLGKGRALKTGIGHVLRELPRVQGVVTADADGQHSARDIVRVAEALRTGGGRSVVGVRAMATGVPLRSRAGNLLTRLVFRFISGQDISDTQTGLRAFPRGVLPGLLALHGERYEYEMTVLAHLCRSGDRPVEVPIQTVYLDGNRSSHFDPLRDSMRIYFVLLRFYLSSLTAAALDLAGFSLVFLATHNLWLGVAVGRLSAVLNFVLNDRLVFQGRGPLRRSLWRYCLLAAVIAVSSYGLLRGATDWLRWNVFAAKITGDVLLSLVSFYVQRTFVFRRGHGPG